MLITVSTEYVLQPLLFLFDIIAMDEEDRLSPVPQVFEPEID